MKTREERIAFEMNYCQHYGRGKGADMICKAGMDRAAIQKVPTGKDGMKWGPCIDGHTLADPVAHCPKWIRRTREMGERRADSIQRSIDMMSKVMPEVSKWAKASPRGKQGSIVCPVCGGKLMLSEAACNGHIWGNPRC